MKTTLERREDKIIIGNLSPMIFRFLFGFEGRNSRNCKKPIENAIEGHEIVRSVIHPNGGDGGPGEHGGSDERDAGEQKALESENDSRVFQLDPLELEGGPYPD